MQGAVVQLVIVVTMDLLMDIVGGLELLVAIQLSTVVIT
jgi:hypothetical protein